MSRPIIEVRSLSKRYQLGRIGFTSLRAELERWWGRRRGGAEAQGGEFWALRDVSFDVAPGEVLGVIGRNGAGKSTLLKIMSEITEPTEGEVRLRGRTASLLEVGTGFHPELSGRENIFLNGAILGMRRAEIARKFDEIVAFAEVDEFIDTPVKRYSSGMYVRLAFAVAAHLEPEILIIDEVLAVGDHEFQQKCLGKMREVAQQEGRTVIFVSHNMAAVSRLCHRALHLEAGRIAAAGPSGEIVTGYLNRVAAAHSEWQRPATLVGKVPAPKVVFQRGAILDANGSPAGVLAYSSPVTVLLECEERGTTAPWVLRVSVYDRQGNELFSTHDTETVPLCRPKVGQTLRARCRIPGGLLMPGTYTVGVSACELAGDAPVALHEEHEPLLSFEISPEGYAGQSRRGLVGPKIEWSFETR
jgi:lipopolysaccharide transport system ATP-binding protein